MILEDWAQKVSSATNSLLCCAAAAFVSTTRRWSFFLHRKSLFIQAVQFGNESHCSLDYVLRSWDLENRSVCFSWPSLKITGVIARTHKLPSESRHRAEQLSSCLSTQSPNQSHSPFALGLEAKLASWRMQHRSIVIAEPKRAFPSCSNTSYHARHHTKFAGKASSIFRLEINTEHCNLWSDWSIHRLKAAWNNSWSDYLIWRPLSRAIGLTSEESTTKLGLTRVQLFTVSKLRGNDISLMKKLDCWVHLFITGWESSLQGWKTV